MNDWYYKDKVWEKPQEDLFNPEEMYGFVYMITNLQNQKKYIGKKFFWKAKTLPITKTRKRRKKLKVESDWREYYGSSRHLTEDVEKMGIKNFYREILVFCKTKGECAYMETKIQFEHDVLLSDDYYNGIVNCRIGSNSVKHLKEKHVQMSKSVV